MNRFNFGSTLTIGQQQLLAGYKPLASHPPSPHTVSLSSRLPQITPQQSNYSTDIVSPVSQDEDTDPDESESSKRHDTPQAATQYPPSAVNHYHSGEQQTGQSGERVSRRISRRDTTTSEPSSPLPIDPEPFDLDKLQKDRSNNQVYGHEVGAGKSHPDLQSTPGSRNASKKDVNGKGSREVSIYELNFAVTDAGIGLNLDHGLEGNDEGRRQSESRRDNYRAPRALPLRSFPT